MFAWLAVVEYLFARPEMTLAHVHTSADGFTAVGRPVYTLRYVEQNGGTLVCNTSCVFVKMFVAVNQFSLMFLFVENQFQAGVDCRIIM